MPAERHRHRTKGLPAPSVLENSIPFAPEAPYCSRGINTETKDGCFRSTETPSASLGLWACGWSPVEWVQVAARSRGEEARGKHSALGCLLEKGKGTSPALGAD